MYPCKIDSPLNGYLDGLCSCVIFYVDYYYYYYYWRGFFLYHFFRQLYRKGVSIDISHLHLIITISQYMIPYSMDTFLVKQLIGLLG